MGATTIDSSTRAEEWQFLSELDSKQLYRHRDTRIQAETHHAEVNSPAELEYLQPLLQLRRKLTSNVVGVHGWTVAGPDRYCSERIVLKLFSEYIPLRLDQLGNIPEDRAVDISIQSWRGFKQLAAVTGQVPTIKSSMIGFDQHDTAKVWLNPCFADFRTYMPIDRQFTNKSQQEMHILRTLLQLLERHVQKGTYSPPLRTFLNENNSPDDFQQSWLRQKYNFGQNQYPRFGVQQSYSQNNEVQPRKTILPMQTQLLPSMSLQPQKKQFWPSKSLPPLQNQLPSKAILPLSKNMLPLIKQEQIPSRIMPQVPQVPSMTMVPLPAESLRSKTMLPFKQQVPITNMQPIIKKIVANKPVMPWPSQIEQNSHPFISTVYPNQRIPSKTFLPQVGFTQQHRTLPTPIQYQRQPSSTLNLSNSQQQSLIRALGSRGEEIREREGQEYKVTTKVNVPPEFKQHFQKYIKSNLRL